jgi:CHAT domain-containing protein
LGDELLDEADPELAGRYGTLKAALDAKTEDLSRRIAAHAADAEISTLESEIKALARDANQLGDAVRERNPRYAGLAQPEPLMLEDIRKQALDDDTLLLEYTLGEERSYVWAVSRTDFAGFELPSRREIEDKVLDLTQSIPAPQRRNGESNDALAKRMDEAERRYPASARELSRILLVPVASRLGTRRLILVADGRLQTLPFRALPEPGTASGSPLLEAHEIVDMPSASTLAAIRGERPNRHADRTIAVFADSVYDGNDARVRHPQTLLAGNTAAVTKIDTALRGANLRRLEGTRREAEAILAMVRPEQQLGRFGFASTRAAALDADIGRYRFVHFAAHAFIY